MTKRYKVWIEIEEQEEERDHYLTVEGTEYETYNTLEDAQAAITNIFKVMYPNSKKVEIPEKDIAAEAIKIMDEFNPLKNDVDAYLIEVANWGLGKIKEKPKASDYGLAPEETETEKGHALFLKISVP